MTTKDIPIYSNTKNQDKTLYMTFNSDYFISSEDIGGAFNDSVYDKDLNFIASFTSEVGSSPEDNIKKIIEDRLLFRPMNTDDELVAIDSDIAEMHLTEHQNLSNALTLNQMSKEYELLDKMCKRYDFLSLNINENGITVCCSAYSDEKKQVEQRPWLDITPGNVNVIGTAADLRLYFDSSGYDAFEITRAEIADIVDRIGEACGISKLDRVPTLLPLMVDRDTYESCSKWNPSPDYDKVLEAARSLNTEQAEQQHHSMRQSNEVTIGR